MGKRSWKHSLGLITATIVILAGWFLPLPAGSEPPAPPLHNSDRFACNLPPYLTEASCTGNGGVWDAARKWNGGWGLTGAHYGAFSCGTCHVRNPGNGNIKRIRPSIIAPDGLFPGGGSVTAQQAIPKVSSDYGNDLGGHAASSQICEVCHSKTSYHRFDTAGQIGAGGSLGHFNSKDCVTCHRHGAGFRAGCADCHGNSALGTAWPDGIANNINPAYAYADDEADAHARHVAALGGNASCSSCHPVPASGNYHLNGTVEVLGGFSYAGATESCSTITCHANTSAQWESTGCLGCHNVAQGIRAAVGGQFAAKSHHVQGVTVTDAHCYACHWEANSDGTIAVAYHGGSGASGAPVDLVVYGAGSRPTSYAVGTTVVKYTANGSRSEIAKLNGHCLGCHSEQHNDTDVFGDCKTPRQYAWDRTSIAERYLDEGTTNWGKYSGIANAAKKIQTKAFSAHGKATLNQGGWSVTDGEDGVLPNTREGTQNVQCYDCHNSHGSNTPGVTSSYLTFNKTYGGGNLKETQAGKGGYNVTYQAEAIASGAGVVNPMNPGAAQCFDCHETRDAGAKPWGYFSTFGATKPIQSYRDSSRFAGGSTGHRNRFGYRSGLHSLGGHLKASEPLQYPADKPINGLCSGCHDPHGVSPSLGADKNYAVPLLKGTWLTSPYKDDVAQPMATMPDWVQNTSNLIQIDRRTFGNATTRISENAETFGGLCLRCHPKASLTDGINKNSPFNSTDRAKSVDRVHEAVSGWGSNAEHSFPCAKCHNAHSSGLGRLMRTNCLNVNHKGQVPSGGTAYKRLVYGSFPTMYNNTWPICHDAADAAGGTWDKQEWNTVTPW